MTVTLNGKQANQLADTLSENEDGGDVTLRNEYERVVVEFSQVTVLIDTDGSAQSV